MQLESTNCVVCGSKSAKEEAQSFDFLYYTSDLSFRFLRCTQCGHLYLNPRPAPAEVSTIYPQNYSSFTSKFSQKSSPISFVKSQVMKRRLQPFDEVLARGGRVLDVGCGDGQLLIDIKNRYPRVEAYGLDWHFATPVRERLAANNIELYEDVVEQAELPESSFDLVIMNQLIEHLWSPAEALKTIRKSLKPGGLLTIETPNPDGYDRRFFQKGTWGAYYTPRHLNLFSRANLERFLSDNGFCVLQHSNLCAPITWVYSLQSTIRKSCPRLNFATSFLCDTNVLVLATFALIDLIAKSFGVITSNQKVVARRC